MCCNVTGAREKRREREKSRIDEERESNGDEREWEYMRREKGMEMREGVGIDEERVKRVKMREGERLMLYFDFKCSYFVSCGKSC